VLKPNPNKDAMAIYHLSVKPVSRNSGRSSVAAAAYRSADKLHNARDGVTHDYSRKQGVEHSEIVLPKGKEAAWAKDREKLWNAAEAAEKRKDARVAREVEVALPYELNSEERKALARDFSQHLADQYNVAVDFAIHKPHDSSDERNFHVHILMTTRVVNEDALGEKSLIEKENKWLLNHNYPTAKMQIQDIRKQWSEMSNHALERAGLNVRIDHRSFADQGIELAPTQHIGITASEMQKRGIETDRQSITREDAALNAKVIQESPEELFKIITNEKSVFDRNDVAKTVHRYTDNVEDFQVCMAKVMASPELVELRREVAVQPSHMPATKSGQSQTQLAKYSTQTQVNVERDLVGRALRMSEQKTHAVSEKKLSFAIDRFDQQLRRSTGGYGLSDEQQLALNHVTSADRLSVVEGLGGAGKSTLLAAAREAWEAQGYQVHGAALAGKAAEGLEESSGIASRTLASWEYSLQEVAKPTTLLGPKDVFVIDEAGMVSSQQLGRFIEYMDRSGAKLVLVGDSEQLQPINAGAPFRAIAERVDSAGLMEIRRQKVDWQREASIDLAQQRTAQALNTYAQHKRLHFELDDQVTKARLTEDYIRDITHHPDSSRIILAHRRADVRALNQSVREILQDQQQLVKGAEAGEMTYTTNAGKRDFAPGDRFLFLENNRELDVKNGMLGEVLKTEPGYIQVMLDGKDRQVTVPTEEYTAFDHGYATTIHKSQGATVDRSFVLASPTMDRHLTYVALTRHREDTGLYVSQEGFNGVSDLSKRLSRAGSKEMTLDYLEGHEAVNLELPERKPLTRPSQFEVGLNQYTKAYHSIENQKAKGLPVLNRQEKHLQQAHELLEQARPGSAELLDKTLKNETVMQELATLKSGRAKAERIVEHMSAELTGERVPALEPKGLDIDEPLSHDSSRQSGTFKRTTPFEYAVGDFAKAAESLLNQKMKGLPELPRQRKQLDRAAEKLDHIKPGSAELLKATLNYDPKAREMLNLKPGRERTQGIIERMNLGVGRQREQEILAQKALEKQLQKGKGLGLER
jgi:Ti-type conjugative transfer relaxase TraA